MDEVQNLIIFLIIGGVAGWLAGVILKGGGFGVVVNIVVGILGAVLGGWLFGLLGISIGGDVLGAIITSTVGAIVLLFLLSLVRKKT